LGPIIEPRVVNRKLARLAALVAAIDAPVRAKGKIFVYLSI
jgi:hypothetical protein